MTVDEIMDRGVSRLRLAEAHCEIDGCNNYPASHNVELNLAGYAFDRRNVRVCISHYEQISRRMRAAANDDTR